MNVDDTFKGNTVKNYTVNVQQVDAGTAGSVFVVAPHAGKIVGLSAVPFVANAGVKTVLLAKIGGVTVTAPAWELSTTQAIGVATTVVPTATNSVAKGQVIEIVSDGGSTSTMPASYTISIDRTA